LGERQDVEGRTLELLKSWGYKRCPHCKAGVRKMYGCTHMKCLCGYHFCWHCLQSLQACEDEGCTQEEAVEDDNDEYSDDGGIDEDTEAGAEDDSDATIDAQPTQTSPQPLVQQLVSTERMRDTAMTDVSTLITFASGRVLTIAQQFEFGDVAHWTDPASSPAEESSAFGSIAGFLESPTIAVTGASTQGNPEPPGSSLLAASETSVPPSPHTSANAPLHTLPSTTGSNPQPTPRRGRNRRRENLDAGSADYWQNRDLDFGDEPGDSYENFLQCLHRFETPAVSITDHFKTCLRFTLPGATTSGAPPFTDAKIEFLTGGLQCHRCWVPMMPQIVVPAQIKAMLAEKDLWDDITTGYLRGVDANRHVGYLGTLKIMDVLYQNRIAALKQKEKDANKGGDVKMMREPRAFGIMGAREKTPFSTDTYRGPVDFWALKQMGSGWECKDCYIWACEKCKERMRNFEGDDEGDEGMD